MIDVTTLLFLDSYRDGKAQYTAVARKEGTVAAVTLEVPNNHSVPRAVRVTVQEVDQ